MIPNHWHSLRYLLFGGLAGVLLAGCAAMTEPTSRPTAEEASAATKDNATPRPFTRLFFQDHDASTLKYLTLKIDNRQQWSHEPAAVVPYFPKLDPKRQKLVQMDAIQQKLLLGVRDDDNGQFQSGWVLIDTGVGYIDHGDHGHWTFKRSPAILDQRLDNKQGNPAHLYVYNDKFYLANDMLNGYTRIDPSQYRGEKDGTIVKGKPQFIVGGGNHITLAVVDDKVGYSCWIDGGGPNKGRVDVTPITDAERCEPAYSFHLPHGGIHGAIACADKVFFAPAAGICWVRADRPLKENTKTVQVHHIDLGTEDDKPRRTGAFSRHRHYVLFTTGKASQAALAILDAKQDDPKPWFVPLPVPAGTQPVSPVVVDSAYGPLYAFVFCDRVKPVDGVSEVLHVIDLDPNRDGRLDDAKLVQTLTVGASAVEGHFGHHDLTCDAEAQYAFFTNPGDGTIAVLWLKTLQVVHTIPVGGKPTAIVAVGSRETDD